MELQLKARPKRILELILQGLILISVIIIYIESLGSLQAWSTLFQYIERGIGVIFLADYIYRVISAPRRWAYMSSVTGIVDLLSAIPILFVWGDLRAFRTLKLLRILRLLQLLRLSKAMRRLELSFKSIKDDLLVYGALSTIFLVICSSVVFNFEHLAQPDKYRNQFDALWWGVCTLTTVGYGDMYPITPMGRIFTVVMLIIGVGLIAVPTGLMVSALSRHKD